jgi:hypothetical protein
MNDNSYGRWRVDKKTLILLFDTAKSANSRYKGLLYFNIKNKKLYERGLTKELYNRLKSSINQDVDVKAESIVLPSFKKLSKQQNQVIRNYKGKRKK